MSLRLTWQHKHPDCVVTTRDVAQPVIPHVDELAIAAFQAPPEKRTDAMKQATRLSDELIAELKQADILLISAPMYNFSIPSALKAWIDHIVRAGHTFAMDSDGFHGLLTTQKAFVVSAYGSQGYRNDGPMSAMNFVEPYLQTLFSFLGISDIQFFGVEGMMASPEAQAKIVEQAHAQIRAAIG